MIFISVILLTTLGFSQRKMVKEYKNNKMGITFNSPIAFEVRNENFDEKEGLVDLDCNEFGIEIETIVISKMKTTIIDKLILKKKELLLDGEEGFKEKKVGNITLFYKSDNLKNSVVYFIAKNNKYLYCGGSDFIELPLEEALKLFNNLKIKEKL